jgi:hypothetical protein
VQTENLLLNEGCPIIPVWKEVQVAYSFSLAFPTVYVYVIEVLLLLFQTLCLSLHCLVLFSRYLRDGPHDACDHFPYKSSLAESPFLDAPTFLALRTLGFSLERVPRANLLKTEISAFKILAFIRTLKSIYTLRFLYTLSIANGYFTRHTVAEVCHPRFVLPRIPVVCRTWHWFFTTRRRRKCRRIAERFQECQSWGGETVPVFETVR